MTKKTIAIKLSETRRFSWHRI